MQITAREREICDLLRLEPLIAQEELAARLGITRSSVAVHISNLIKKGIILGKGYVFSQQAVCSIVGEASFITTVDGCSDNIIERRAGGLAVKGCQALHNFDLSLKVYTALGTDQEGDDLFNLLSKDADVNGIVREPGSCSKQWVIIKRASKVETFENCPNYNEVIQNIYSVQRPWMDSNFLWVDPVYLPDIMQMITESAQEPPRIITCTLEPLQQNQTVDVHIMGIKDGTEPVIPPGNHTAVFTDGRHYVTARHNQEEVQVSILPGQQFDVEKELERFAAGIIYGLSRGSQLRQALRIAIGNAAYQV